jgi:hypothetical protein
VKQKSELRRMRSSTGGAVASFLGELADLRQFCLPTVSFFATIKC